MSYSNKHFVVFALALILGLGGAVSLFANPTCRCDEICSRKEQQCLNAGGTLNECADLYDSCFITCGDTWPCGDTSQIATVADTDRDSLQESFGFNALFLVSTDGAGAEGAVVGEETGLAATEPQSTSGLQD